MKYAIVYAIVGFLGLIVYNWKKLLVLGVLIYLFTGNGV